MFVEYVVRSQKKVSGFLQYKHIVQFLIPDLKILLFIFKNWLYWH